MNIRNERLTLQASSLSLLSKYLLGEGLSTALLSSMVLVAVGIAIVNYDSN